MKGSSSARLAIASVLVAVVAAGCVQPARADDLGALLTAGNRITLLTPGQAEPVVGARVLSGVLGTDRIVAIDGTLGLGVDDSGGGQFYRLAYPSATASAVGGRFVDSTFDPAQRNSLVLRVDGAIRVFDRLDPSVNRRFDLDSYASLGNGAPLKFQSGDPNAGTTPSIAAGFGLPVRQIAGSASVSYLLHVGVGSSTFIPINNGFESNPLIDGGTIFSGPRASTFDSAPAIAAAATSQFGPLIAVVGTDPAGTTELYSVDRLTFAVTPLGAGPSADAGGPLGLTMLTSDELYFDGYKDPVGAVVHVASGAAHATVVVDREGRGVTSVGYATANGSMQMGRDFVPGSGRLFFEEGDSQKTISVKLSPGIRRSPGTLRVVLFLPRGDSQSGAVVTTGPMFAGPARLGPYESYATVAVAAAGPLRLSALRLSPDRLVPGPFGPGSNARPRSLRLTYALSLPARTTITIRRRYRGRLITQWKLSRSDKAGPDVHLLTGTLYRRGHGSRSRLVLKPGRYLAVVSAKDALGRHSKPQSAPFVVRSPAR
jgi:hypothetical protein